MLGAWSRKKAISVQFLIRAFRVFRCEPLSIIPGIGFTTPVSGIFLGNNDKCLEIWKDFLNFALKKIIFHPKL